MDPAETKNVISEVCEIKIPIRLKEKSFNLNYYNVFSHHTLTEILQHSNQRGNNFTCYLVNWKECI